MNLKSKKKFEGQFFVVCQNIRSLFNVGSVFRTSDAFAVDKVFLTGITGRPPRKEISKVALGADQYLPWEYRRQPRRLIKEMKEQGIRIVALEQAKGSKNFNNWKPRYPLALVLGNEPKGLPKSLLALVDEIVEIPMYGRKESLNVSVAYGVIAQKIGSAKGITKKKAKSYT